MFIKLFCTDLVKLKHSKLLIILMPLPVLSAIFGCVNFYFNQEILQKEWYSLWTQFALFFGLFFFPIMIGLCASLISLMEHKKNCWAHILTTPVPYCYLALSKLTVLSMLILIQQLIFLSLYLVAGWYFKFESPIPYALFGWIIRGWLASITLGSLQLYLSTRSRSFTLPVGISLILTFIGILFYQQNIPFYYPHSLLIVGMGIISQESLSHGDFLTFIVMTVLYTALFLTLTTGYLKRKAFS